MSLTCLNRLEYSPKYIAQDNSNYSVQRHARSRILVPVESSYSIVNNINEQTNGLFQEHSLGPM